MSVALARALRGALLVAVLLGTGSASAQAPASVAGTVRDADGGGPLPGAAVQLFATGVAEATAGQATGLDGAFRFDGLVPGTYVLRARFVGYGEVQREVVVGAGQALTVDLALRPVAEVLGGVVVSASRRREQVLDAPASITVLGPRQLEQTAATNPVALLAHVPGMDQAQTGIDRREIALRGFNNAFGGTVYVLTDYRPAAVPSLAVNAEAVMPIAAVDLDRVEVVRGPGAALYGPGVVAGVVHFVSRDPFVHRGTTLQLQGGQQAYLAGTVRHAGTLGQRLGFKVVASYAQGEEFGLDRSDPAVQSLLAQEVAPRDDAYWRYNVYGSAVYRLRPGAQLTLDAGRSALKSQLLAGIGTLQADGFAVSHAQVRLQAGGFFAQAYVNANDAGDSYNYGRPAEGDDCVPAPLEGRYCRPFRTVDRSRLAAVQAQYTLGLGGPARDRVVLVAGADASFLRPNTEGTVMGRFEGENAIDQLGLYVQGTAALVPWLDLTLALRGDYNNVFETLGLAPRAAAVLKATPEQTFRLTYNRATGSPTTNSLFLDLVALRAGGVTVRAVGNARGFTFGRSEAFRAVAGTDLVASSLLPTALGQRRPVGADLADVYALLYGQIAATPPQAIQAALAAQGIAVDVQTVQQLVALLSPAATPVTGFSRGVLGYPSLTAPGEVRVIAPDLLGDVPALRPDRYETLEVGYKGVFGGRLLVGADVYTERRRDLVAPQSVESPFVFAPNLPADLTAALAVAIAQNPQLAGAFGQVGLTAAQAAALVVGFSGGAFEGIPVGIVQPRENDPGPGLTPELLLTFRNFGDLRYWGGDVYAEFLATDRLALAASASFLNRNFFSAADLGEENPELTLSTNSPRFSVRGVASYAAPDGLSATLAARYVDGFRVQDGIYEGFVPSHFLLDVGGGADLGRLATGLRLDVQVNNALGRPYAQYVGAPRIGRFAVARLTYHLGPR